MEFGEYFRFLAALGVVLVLIAGLAALARRSGFGGRPTIAPGSGGERRLALIEVRPLDAKRKLVLLRRDDREHLVLLGVAGDLLIESDIPAAPAKPTAAMPAPVTPPMPGGSLTAGDGIVGRVLGRLRRQPS